MFGTDEASGNLIRRKLHFIMVIMLVGLCVLVVRLGYLQIVCTRYYTKKSEDNRIRPVRIIPPRGVVYDRNGVVPLVDNETAFDVCVAPSNVERLEYMNEQAREVFRRLNFTPAELEGVLEELRKLKESRIAAFDPVVIKEDIDKDAAAYLAENNSHLPEMIIRARPKRRYRGIAAHIIGYTAMVDKRDLENGYELNDVIGKDGVEAVYEESLHGDLGWKMVEVDAYGRVIRDLQSLAVNPEPGSSVELTLDLDLQRKAEELLEGKTGSVIAIDPRNGEVLAMASKPDYDARTITKNWNEISSDPQRPLLNRAIMAEYPPGSTFKIITATTALEERKVDENVRFYCNGRFYMRNWGRPFKCHKPSGHGSMNIHQGIIESCNVFFYNLAANRGVTVSLIHKYATMYGLGKKIGIDLPGECAGYIPDTDKRPGDKINVSIGQGEVLVTPLQMANVICVIANRGFAYKPHIVRQPQKSKPDFDLRDRVSYGTIDIIRNALFEVAKRGNCRLVHLPDYQAAGKTGSAQNPHGDEHAWFISFAPFNRPEIAVAVVVENAGRGSQVAVPIASEIYAEYFHKEQPDLAKK